MSWLAALGMVVVLAVGAAAPGRVAAGLEGSLAERLTREGRWRVGIEADPFLDLPRGRLPEVRIDGYDLPVGPLRWPELRLTARDVQVPPAALWGLAAPALLVPAPMQLRLSASQEALTREANRLVASGLLRDVPMPPGPARQRFGPTASIESLAITLQPDRVALEARIATVRGRSLTCGVSFRPACVEGRAIRATGMKLVLDGVVMPAFITELAARALPPIVDLDAWPALGPEWRIGQVSVGTGTLVVEAAGPWSGPPR